MTDFIVLRADEDGEWEKLPGVHSASTRRAAVEFALASKNDSQPLDGEYVAVPARSWKPLKVKVEKAIKFS